MKQKHIRLCLDIVLGVGILTLMNKQLFGLLYHEIAGVAVVLTMLAHIAINIKAIRGMARGFRRIPLSARLCLIIDILLTAALVSEGISGVMISKKLFSGISTQSFLFKAQHYFSAALTIILLGLHIGLHMGRRRLPMKAAVALTVAAVICAGFGITGSSIGRWLSMPFSASGEQHGPEGMEAGNGRAAMDSVTDEQVPENSAPAEDGGSVDAEPQTATEDGSDRQPQELGGGMPQGRDHTPAPFYRRVWSILQYWGLSFTVAMATWFIMRRRRRRPAHVQG